MRQLSIFLAATAMVLLGLARPAGAQLRPLDPFDWTLLDEGRTLGVQVGMGAFRGQRAALAGTRGSLQEWGNFAARWRTGRVVIEAGGTMLRRFQDETRIEPPLFHAETPDDGRRSDAGDYRIATIVRLTPEGALPVALRFGTRLPTTDDKSGLDRDMTDFFALLGAELRRERLRVSGEMGLGIYGTRFDVFEQVDPLLYNLDVRYRISQVQLLAVLTGQWNGPRTWEVRGNDNLRETRLGARLGERRWLEVGWVRGLEEFSPSGGFLISAGRGW
jgi:hypothetical protein